MFYLILYKLMNKTFDDSALRFLELVLSRLLLLNLLISFILLLTFDALWWTCGT